MILFCGTYEELEVFMRWERQRSHCISRKAVGLCSIPSLSIILADPAALQACSFLRFFPREPPAHTPLLCSNPLSEVQSLITQYEIPTPVLAPVIHITLLFFSPSGHIICFMYLTVISLKYKLCEVRNLFCFVPRIVPSR